MIVEGGWFDVDETHDPGRVRRAAIRLAERLAFDDYRAGEVGIVASELATNLERHATSGAVALHSRRIGDNAAVELITMDRGPGIRNLDVVLADGYSTIGTLGIGLGAVQRLSSWFDVYTAPGEGTVFAATLWRDAPPTRAGYSALTRPIRGEEVCGDSWGAQAALDVDTFVLADGLGHGPLAEIASAEAVKVMPEVTTESPAQVLEVIHRRLHPTRGAAVAVVQYHHQDRVLRFAGAGNVATWLCADGRRQALLSSPGIVGHNVRRIREDELDVPPGSVLIMHSDGLTEKWGLDGRAGQLSRSPEVIAGIVMRDAGVRNDDASILVAKLE